MKEKFLAPIKNYFLQFTQIQLIISLALLIILPNWGLPLSLLSPIGNLICTPFFMAFLILSSIIFFTELLCIPNGILIFILEKISNLWLFLIPDWNNRFLVGFTKPPLWFTILIPACTLFILAHKRINTHNKTILALACIFALSCGYLKLFNVPKDLIAQIPCNNGSVTFLRNNSTNTLIDPGYIGQRVSAPSWVQFTLLPEITKLSGTTMLDHVIIMQPSITTFDAITQLCKAITIQELYIPVFDGPMQKNMYKSFYALTQEAKNRNIRITRIGRKPSCVTLEAETKLCITPLHKKLSYQKLCFPALHICIKNPDNRVQNAAHSDSIQALQIYSAKAKRAF